ncbi:MAG: DNA topoisomerase 4 subunit A [Lachnospiraceae bacterium]|nr:DNA topoisomerase 4 subunit A [Lachnospiraceae bacterium]
MAENIIKTEYSEVMQKSYIDYAMSVIVSRALPDVRDGLKPVQRRTLYDMHELGIAYNKPYRKSARIVGDTMGKYHPHGDSSIYDSLVVMAQDFKKGLALVDGHGHFGNIEGDPAAAMRYTEARLQKVTQDAFLADLDKDVIDFIPNFDETEKEPSVLPCKIPNLLINGSEGIAVGMVTAIPPHNVSEVIDATKAFIENPEISTKQLMRHIKGPDFPTGGIVINKDELEEIYDSGVGKIRVRGKVETEKGKNGKTNVVITEIPYPMIGANISKFLSDVADLYESKKCTDIVDISNQTSKEGIRIVIELKKDADADNFINMLYKKTKLEDTVSVNMLAIANGRPETLGLKGILKHCADFYYECNRRKYTNLLEKANEKKEIQEGLIRACNVIDLIIEILRGSKDRAMAKRCLVEGDTTGIRFKSKESEIMAAMLRFTERQANAILEMRLYKLIGLELDALIKEHEENMANIFRYEDILERHDSMTQVILSDLEQFKKEFGRKRRTVIENAEEAVYEEKKIEEANVYVLMDRFGYVKCVDENTFIKNRETALEEHKFFVLCKNTGKVCLFTDIGQLHTIKVSDIPMGRIKDKGVPIDNISTYTSKNEQILAFSSKSELNLYRLIFITKMGMCKIVSGGEFDVSRRVIAATKLEDGDSLLSVAVMKEQKNVVLASEDGYFIRFSVDEIPEKKKAAVGVRGIKLSKGALLAGVYYEIPGEATSFMYGDKSVEFAKIKLSKRDGKGTKIRI